MGVCVCVCVCVCKSLHQLSTWPALTSRDKSGPDSNSGAPCSFITRTTRTSTRKTVLFLQLMFHYQQFKVRSCGGDGVMCDGNCYLAGTWCNDLVPRYCADSGVMTNDLELCTEDEFWKPINCSLTGEDGEEYPGERCTDCVNRTRNYCSYPQGLAGIPVIVMITAVGYI